jgi:signal transduction histidine kinase
MPAQNMGPLTHGLAIAVTDNGTGMDETTLAQAMEPFFTTTSRPRALKAVGWDCPW